MRRDGCVTESSEKQDMQEMSYDSIVHILVTPYSHSRRHGNEKLMTTLLHPSAIDLKLFSNCENHVTYFLLDLP